MKESMWNKKQEELTVGESVKLTAIVLAIMYGMLGAVYGAAYKWDDICEFFTGLKDKISKKKEG